MSRPEDLYESLAAGLREAAATGRPVPPLRDALSAHGIAGAYAVQQANTRHALAQGRRIVGRKIGLTSPAVQRQLGVDQPDYGVLLDDMALCDGEEIAAGRVLQAKVEGEVAFVLGRDLAQPNATPAEVVRATEFVLPAIEIVGSRIANWDIKFADTVADNASSGLFVLGAKQLPVSAVDLVGCAMRMTRGGEEVSKGSGAACMGNPLNAAAWLADKMVEFGRPLQAGDIILSGALGPMVPVNPGDTFEASVDGLGKVIAKFGTVQA